MYNNTLNHIGTCTYATYVYKIPKFCVLRGEHLGGVTEVLQELEGVFNDSAPTDLGQGELLCVILFTTAVDTAVHYPLCHIWRGYGMCIPSKCVAPSSPTTSTQHCLRVQLETTASHQTQIINSSVIWSCLQQIARDM